MTPKLERLTCSNESNLKINSLIQVEISVLESSKPPSKEIIFNVTKDYTENEVHF